MEHYVGLDVSLKLTAICIADRTGKIVREGVVTSDPETIAAFIKSHAPHVARVGLLDRWARGTLGRPIASGHHVSELYQCSSSSWSLAKKRSDLVGDKGRKLFMNRKFADRQFTRLYMR